MNMFKPVRRRHVVVFLLLTILVWNGCRGFKITRYYEKGAVATSSPLATQIGRDIFARGGNAFDVAVAVGFALAVVYPEAGNIGGGGFAVIREGKNGSVRALDFRETAPRAATEQMFLDVNGEVIEGNSTYGALAAGVPGTVAGFYELWKNHGALSWEELVRTAADLADSGFVLDDYLVRAFAEYRDELTGYPETSIIFFPEGRTLKKGERFIQKDLAATLHIIASEGPGGFYQGQIADKIDSCMKAYGGLITKEDLAAYTPVWREPLHFTFDSLDIYTMPPPSSGGIAIGQILKILEPFDFSRFSVDSPDFIHLFCEAARRAFADRSQYLGDPAFYRIPSNLLDDAYLSERRNTITMGHASNSQLVGPGLPYHESDQTTHFSVCDREGNMVAITYTINTIFGSKLVVGGAGFLLNNEMDDFSIKPGIPNTWGLVGAEANKIEPGKRMLSSMSPTLILKNQKPYLILGSRGGSRIITTVAQAILNVTRFGLNPDETVVQPRIHHQWLPDKIVLEEDAYSVDIKQTLIRYGHYVEEVASFGELHLISIDPLGIMSGASDPRKIGQTDGY